MSNEAPPPSCQGGGGFILGSEGQVVGSFRGRRGAEDGRMALRLSGALGQARHKAVQRHLILDLAGLQGDVDLEQSVVDLDQVGHREAA